jgi:hypothetical protein
VKVFGSIYGAISVYYYYYYYYYYYGGGGGGKITTHLVTENP